MIRRIATILLAALASAGIIGLTATAASASEISAPHVQVEGAFASQETCDYQHAMLVSRGPAATVQPCYEVPGEGWYFDWIHERYLGSVDFTTEGPFLTHAECSASSEASAGEGKYLFTQCFYSNNGYAPEGWYYDWIAQ